MFCYTDIVRAIVDSEILLDLEEVPSAILPSLEELARVPNIDKEKMKREKIGGWQRLPNNINLFHYGMGHMMLPRGLAHRLNTLMQSYGHKVSWIDKRYTQDKITKTKWKEINVRPYQEEAIEAILKSEQGYWKSPPGSGKTVGILEAIRRSNQPALVIVNTTNIAEQWRDRARSFLGRDVEVGLIGDGSFDASQLTIAMQQTLWSQREELQDAGFFDKWGFVCLDECHHLPAETFTDILSRFTARYRIGVSGTPTKNFEKKPLLEATLGPMIHETPKKMLVEQGWLMKPSIEAIYTGFTFDFFSTHEHFGCKQNKKCFEPGCTRPNDKKRHGNNYQEMVSALALDKDRNDQIAARIAQDLAVGRCVLVLSRRLNHLDTLCDRTREIISSYMYPKERKLFMLTGKETTEERMKIAEEADKGRCVIFSTLADEALDIPRIDRIHLAFPTRNADLIRQQIGRGERPHQDKTDVIVYDYVDMAGPLRNQYRERAREVYIQEGWIVNERK